MRAKEFIKEDKSRGPIGNVRQFPSRGLHLFWDQSRTDSNYTLNRVMMAAACADGSDNYLDIPGLSWVGKDRSAHPYTELEQKMLKQAYRAAGAGHRDLNNGDMRSREVDSTNKTSPIKGFKGYAR